MTAGYSTNPFASAIERAMTTSAATHFALPSNAPAAARGVFKLLKQLRQGTLDLQLPDGSPCLTRGLQDGARDRS